jgi:hypothetical protein
LRLIKKGRKEWREKGREEGKKSEERGGLNGDVHVLFFTARIGLGNG